MFAVSNSAGGHLPRRGGVLHVLVPSLHSDATTLLLSRVFTYYENAMFGNDSCSSGGVAGSDIQLSIMCFMHFSAGQKAQMRTKRGM